MVVCKQRRRCCYWNKDTQLSVSYGVCKLAQTSFLDTHSAIVISFMDHIL